MTILNLRDSIPLPDIMVDSELDVDRFLLDLTSLSGNSVVKVCWVSPLADHTLL